MTKRVLETVTRYEDKPDYKTTEQMTENCCVPSPSLPCREKMLSQQWGGYSVEHFLAKHGIVLDQYGRDANGKYIEVRDVARKNPCGEEITRYKVEQKPCCDFVEPMVWDWDGSAEVVAPGTRVFVGFIGGAPPFYIEVRGEGFTLDGYRQRNGWVDTNYFWVYASSISCGWCPITVSDGCSVVVGGVRCTLGQWVEDVYDPHTDCFCSGEWSHAGVYSNMQVHTCISGDRMHTQYSNWQECDTHGPFPFCVPDGPWCFGVPCGTGDSCIWYDYRYRWVC